MHERGIHQKCGKEVALENEIPSTEIQMEVEPLLSL